MNSSITDCDGYWIFTGDDPAVTEHFFVEAKTVQKTKTVYIQVDLCDGTYTFSAAGKSARPFFDNDLPAETEFPIPVEVYDSLEDASKSPFFSDYQKYLEILKKEKNRVQADSFLDGIKKIFGRRRNNGKKA